MMLIELVLAASVIGCLALFILYKILDRKKPEQSQDTVSSLLPKQKKLREKYTSFSQKSYLYAEQIPLLRGYLRRIRFRVESVNQYDEYMLRHEVMKIIFISLGVSALTILVFTLLNPSLFFIFMVLLAVLFVNGIIIDVFINRLEDRLLRQLKDFLEDVRHHFHQTKMVDEAIYEAVQLASYESKLQGLRIYSIVTSHTPKEKLREYESVAPNRFLKAIANISVLVQEKGDVVNERGSAYLNGLSGLMKEINYEIIRRDRLSYVLKGLSLVAIAPIFFTLPIRNWAITYFPSMESFYDSRVGLVSQVVLYASILIAYMLIRKMREVSEAKYVSRNKRWKWEENLYKNKGIRFFVDLFLPGPYQKKHFTTELLLKKANSPLKMEWLYLHRLLLAVSMTTFFIGFFLISHYLTIQHTLYKPTTGFAMGKMTQEELKKAEDVTEFDRKVYMHFKEVKETDYKDVVAYVSEELGMQEHDKKVLDTATRALNKIHTVETAYLKWWEVVIAALIGWMSYHFPIVLLHFQAFIRKMDMEDEINQYYTIIDIVSQFESISVANVLEWMERFSVTFKEPLRTCLLNFDSGQEEALDQLKQDVSFVPFSRVVDRLKLAVTKVSIKAVFDDIDIEKQFYIEQRNKHNEYVLNEKAWWGQVIGFTPLYTLLFLYLIIPMLYISTSQTTDIMNQIKF
ncbi:hypothetical protein ACFWGC_23755 [Cytobacillus pseudoceanisediminis]|uniref:hypothetical protein n=2 Tax=Bacillati TaxID=1783272 RepID=UPI0036549E7B